jgi:hypothetical protein
MKINIENKYFRYLELHDKISSEAGLKLYKIGFYEIMSYYIYNNNLFVELYYKDVKTGYCYRFCRLKYYQQVE